MGGTSTATSTSKVSAASGQELEILKALQSFGAQSQGQMGDLSNIASGNLQITPEQEASLRKAIEAQTQMQMRGLNTQFTQDRAGLANQMSAQGINDSSMEMLGRGMLFNSQQDRTANVLNDAASKYYQGRIQLPQQNAQMQLAANAQLYQQLQGSYGQALQNYQGTRMGNSSQTQTQTQTPGLMEMGLGLGQSFMSGGGVSLFSKGAKKVTE